MNGYTKALLAGAINWRGHLAASVDRENIVIPRVTVISHDRASAEWLLSIGGDEEWKDDNNGRRWLWRCLDDEAVMIVREVRPWLKSLQKQIQADLILNLVKGPNALYNFDLNPDVTTKMREARALDRGLDPINTSG